MRTRRVGSFLIGAWLLANLLIGFVVSQNLRNIDRFLADPPASAARTVETVGSPATRLLLFESATKLNRHILEAWEWIQIGLAAALLITALVPDARGPILTAGAAILFVICCATAFYLRPAITELQRVALAGSVSGAIRTGPTIEYLEAWLSILGVFKTLLSVLIALRLLGDWHAWARAVSYLRVRSASSMSANRSSFESRSFSSAAGASSKDLGHPGSAPGRRFTP